MGIVVRPAGSTPTTGTIPVFYPRLPSCLFLVDYKNLSDLLSDLQNRFRAFMESWKTTDTFFHLTCSISSSVFLRIDSPSSKISPLTIRPGGFTSLKRDMARVDFPHPDSPAIPRASFLSTAKAHVVNGFDNRLAQEIIGLQMLDIQNRYFSRLPIRIR